MTTPILEIRDLTKTYGQNKAVKGVSFDVHEGEMFGLLGPNGAGKTTTMSMIAGLLSPTSGTALVGGKQLRTDFQARHLLGLAPQELALYGDLTARENLLFFGQLYRIESNELAKRVDEILDAVGLLDRANDKAGQFSGGMKRRLNLGIALVHRPKLVLLDEPTTGVDPQSRNHIFEGVRRLNEQGVTIVYTSHYMEEVQALCKRIGIIDHGNLIACDTLENLLQQLPGFVRFHVLELSSDMQQRIREWPDAKLLEQPDNLWALECRDVKETLLKLVGLFQENNVELLSLETEEPNLENVFLHLTGHALRD